MCPCQGFSYSDWSSCVLQGNKSSGAATSQAAADAQGPMSPYEHLHGRHGIASCELNPTGYVTIDQQNIPARSRSGTFLPDGCEVRVVMTDPFGVTVVADDV
jgi:membrane-bound ClpP family serine protease